MASKIKKQAIAILISLTILISLMTGVLYNLNSIKAFATGGLNYGEFVYLSDIQYSAGSTAEWVGIKYDQNAYNATISLKIDGAWKTFDKGVFASANSTVIYDIRNYNYKYFTAYVGIEKGNEKNGNGAKFFVYTSADGTSWELKTPSNPNVKMPSANADFLSANISGANYLKLVTNNNGASQGDQTVWAEAKLTNASDGNEMLAYYDEQIKAKGNVGIENEELELLVLQREFVRKAGQSVLKKFTTESGENNQANEAVLNWLLNDVENLREFIMGGSPMAGNWYNSLTVLSSLYKNYKNDLNDTRTLKKEWYPDWYVDRTYGQLYRTMMFAIALTHDTTVGSWMQKTRVENQSDPLRRYAIYRYMLETDRFVGTRDANGIPKYDTTPWFTSLRVEEMRYIMMNIIDDESILWLNDYVQTRINANPGSAGNLHTPHSYIAYTDPNYNNPVYYAEENREYFNELFAVDDRNNPGQKIGMWDTSYEITGGVDSPTYTLTVTRGTATDKVQKVWMNFRNKFGTGSVCGGISKSGCNIRGVRGIPASVIGQPGHAAILAYGKNAEGKGYWTIDNNVGGWTVATKNERHMLGWGNESWQRTIYGTVVYFHLAQDALNDYDNFVKAEENVMLAKVYAGDLTKQEELYEKALTAQPINLDAWYGLIQTYKANSNKTEENFYALANRIANNMVGYPLPMHHLLDVIKEKMVSTESAYKHTLLEKQALTASTLLATNINGPYPGAVAAKVEAQFILGRADTTVAEFVLDGENAGSIVWASQFDGTGFTWKYSLDGKQTWKDVTFTADEPHVHKLEEAEIDVITPENDIYIHIYGVNESDENYYKIDISNKASLPNNLYLNDFENKIIGVDNSFEWRYVNVDENGQVVAVSSWKSYSDGTPDCSGNQKVQVRVKASGGKLASDAKLFEFTTDTDSDTRKYITVDHLSIVSYSSQSLDSKRPNYATNAIDGNGKTYWHTSYAESVRESGNTPYLIIKLDSPRYISGLEFVQYQYNSGIGIFAKKAKVFVSEDNENWTEAGKLEGIMAIDDLKVVQFNESVYGQYVKLVLEELYETNKNDGVFATVSLVNLYEDTTKTESNIPGDDDPNTPGDDKPDNPGDDNPSIPGDDNPVISGGGSNGDNSNEPADNNNGAVWIVVSIIVVSTIATAVVSFLLIKRKNH